MMMRIKKIDDDKINSADLLAENYDGNSKGYGYKENDLYTIEDYFENKKFLEGQNNSNGFPRFVDWSDDFLEDDFLSEKLCFWEKTKLAYYLAYYGFVDGFLSVFNGRFYRGIFRKIKNVFSWIPVLWKDEPWDCNYFLMIISKKLQTMIDSGYYDERKSTTAKEDREKILASMKEMQEILKMLIADNPYQLVEEERKALGKKWGKGKVWIVDGEHRSTCENIHTEKDARAYRRELSNLYKLEGKRQLAMQKRLGEIFQKDVMTWWD